MKKETKKQKPTRLEKLFKRLHFWERLTFRVVFPYKRHGDLRKHNDGAYIIVGNHYSVWDVVYTAMATDKPVHFMAKAELWDKPVLRKLVRKVDAIPVKRDGTDVAAVKTCMKLLKNGEIVNIFPEGTRNHSYDDFLPFKSGAAALSIKTQTPIIPVVLIGKLKYFKKVDIVYGEPIEFKKYYGKRLTSEDMEQCDNELRDILKNMRQAFIDKYHPKLRKLK